MLYRIQRHVKGRTNLILFYNFLWQCIKAVGVDYFWQTKAVDIIIWDPEHRDVHAFFKCCRHKTEEVWSTIASVPASKLVYQPLGKALLALPANNEDVFLWFKNVWFCGEIWHAADIFIKIFCDDS